MSLPVPIIVAPKGIPKPIWIKPFVVIGFYTFCKKHHHHSPLRSMKYLWYMFVSCLNELVDNECFSSFQYKLARRPRAQMHRGLADLVYNIRVPRPA